MLQPMEMAGGVADEGGRRGQRAPPPGRAATLAALPLLPRGAPQHRLPLPLGLLRVQVRWLPRCAWLLALLPMTAPSGRLLPAMQVPGAAAAPSTGILLLSVPAPCGPTVLGRRSRLAS